MIAIRVGYEYAIIPESMAAHVPLVQVGTAKGPDGKEYVQYRGRTYKDAGLLDEILDRPDIKTYRKKEGEL